MTSHQSKLRDNKSFFLVFFLVFLFCACNERVPKRPGKVPFTGESCLTVDGGEIWYRVSGTGEGLPVVLIHGGPGGNSYYLKAFEDIGNDRQVVRYDQLGCGKSGYSEDTTLFTIGHFVDELELLRNHLGFPEWHILGHSWGTIIAIEYYRHYPDRVSSLVFGSPCLDATDWANSTKQLLRSLPDSLQEAILKAESTGDYEDPLYLKAMEIFYEKFVWGYDYIQTEFDSSMSDFNFPLYSYMWGPSEFTVTGTLKDFSAIDFLHEIKVPVLFTVGEYDEILPEIVRSYADKVNGSQYFVFKGSSHMTPWNAREENVKVVRDFLNQADLSILIN